MAVDKTVAIAIEVREFPAETVRTLRLLVVVKAVAVVRKILKPRKRTITVV